MLLTDNEETLTLNRNVIVKQYAPKTFEKIRELSGVTKELLMDSLDPSKNIKQIQNAGEGAGASGSFFFFTKDMKFILKTMNKTEIDHLLRVLPEYYEHLDTI
jgi:1-phosphatidylinositol-4-phosphate 5-kinase